MAWREFFLTHFGPGLLGGLTLGDWLRLLGENRFAVAPSRIPRALAITYHSTQNSAFRLLDRWKTGQALNDVAIPPPLFVLGHWRNGTTHLHNLLAVDDRFAFPNTYQALYPHTFLSTEALNSGLISFFMPKRRPMDNVEWSLRSPQEDEFALCVASLKSPCLGWLFPQCRAHYDRYLTFREVSEDEIEHWREAFLQFLQKLTWKYGRPLLLKSPPHTGRIRQLLTMFPQARFVHIHRDPYAVFPSSRRTFRVNSELNGLQRTREREDEFDDWILRQYRALYDAFFEERGLIPAGHYHEVGFEGLESDPIGEVGRIYEALDLPDFRHVEPELRRYVDSIAGYTKNTFPSLPADLRRRIANEWRPCFEEWGYPV
jgi:omega-hydroxy-beta-dihydromenaquinone-9 sulfotransferase